MRWIILCILATTLTGAASADRLSGRTYSVFDGRDSTARAPLVILLHGMTGTGKGMQRRSGFDKFAARQRIVATYPTAPERRWNDGRWEELGRNDLAARDDVGWIAELIGALDKKAMIDPKQVYLIGHSNGGGMAMRIACDRPDLIAGVAIVSTKQLTTAPCPSGVSMPAIFFYGTDDIVAPHAGRSGRNEHMARRPLGDTLSAAQTLAAWAARNRCDAPGPPRRSDPVPDDAMSLAITDWAGCDAPLRYVEIIGGGHAFPGAPRIRNDRVRRVLGEQIRDVHAGEAALAFWFNAN